MLRTYGPGCDGSIVDPKIQKIPDDATWIDLEEPTNEEEDLVERCIAVDVPTQDEMSEIEPSSRLYERNDALYMTVSVLWGVEEGEPTSTPIGFVLAGNRLVTIRYATPKPVRAFSDHARHDPDVTRDAPTVLVRLLDAIIDRLADELEKIGAEIERLSSAIFRERCPGPENPGRKVDAAADFDRPGANAGHQDPLHGGQHGAAAELPRRLKAPPRSGPRGRPQSYRQPDDRRYVAQRTCDLSDRQFDLPARRLAGAHQHRAERGDEALLLGRGGIPSAHLDRRHLRHELQAFARAQLVVRLSDGARR